jgi:Ca-activated chloride channel family protein
MRFAAEAWLILLLGLPFLVVFLRWNDRRARHRLSVLLGERAEEHVERDNPRLRGWRRFLLLNGIFWLILALARPQWGANEVVVKEKGTDIVIALDISNSMLAEDIPPNRLERAKSEVADFLSRLPRGRIGLVLFAGSAFVQCPLTLDYGTAQIFLRMAGPDMISEQGTAIAAALSTARDLLAGGGGQGGDAFQAILLVTDGEDLEGEWEEELKRCREKDIVILPVGVGLETGGLIPVTDDAGRAAGFMKDADGNVVMTRLDLASLERMAGLSGGTFFRIGEDGLAGERLRDVLVRLGERELEERRISAYKERFVWPLSLAWLSIWFGIVVQPRRRTGVRNRLPLAVGLTLGMILTHLSLVGTLHAAVSLRPPGAAEAEEGRDLYATGQYEEALKAFETARAINPDDSRLSLAVGEALFELGRYDEALREFRRSLALAHSPDLQAESLYNAGTSWLAQDDPARAAEALLRSLQLDADQVDALHNLEVALKWMEQNQQREQQQEQQQDQQQDQEQQDQEQHRQDQEQGRDQQEQGQEQRQQPPPEQPESQDGQEPDDQSDDTGSEEPSPPPEGDQEQMSPEEAMSLLRALDRDEEQLKHSIQQRLRGGKPKSGKRW